MIRRNLKIERLYNVPSFETEWNNLKDKISCGTYFNAFRMEDFMQDIWNVLYKFRIQECE